MQKPKIEKSLKKNSAVSSYAKLKYVFRLLQKNATHEKRRFFAKNDENRDIFDFRDEITRWVIKQLNTHTHSKAQKTF